MSDTPAEETIRDELSATCAVRRIAWTPGETNAELDAALDEHGARTWIFLAPGERRDDARRLVLETHPDTVLLEAALRCDAESAPTDGLLCLDLPRVRGREIAAATKLKSFYWGRRGHAAEVHAVEVHAVEVLDDDLDYDGLVGQASSGLRDAAGAALEALSDLQHGRGSVRALLFAAVAIALVGAAGNTIGVPLLDRLPTGGVARFLLHPAALPALALGLAIRRALPGLEPDAVPSRVAGELTAAEAEREWHAVSGRLAGAWLAALLAVGGITLARLFATGDLSPTELVDDWATSSLICLWALPPIALSRNTERAFSSLVEAAIALFVSLVLMKVTLAFVGFAAGLVLSVVTGFLPFRMPEPVRDAWDDVAKIVAELSFFGTMLGYTWTRARKHFELWLSDELPEA